MFREGDIVRVVDDVDDESCNCLWRVTGFERRKLWPTDEELIDVVLLTRFKTGSRCSTSYDDVADRCTWIDDPWFTEDKLELDEGYTAWERFYEHPEQEIPR